MIVVGDAGEVDGKRVLAEHADQQNVFEVVSDAAMKSAVEVELNTLIIIDHARVEPHVRSPLGYYHFGSVCDCFHQL